MDDQETTASRVSLVTFFEDRAEVTREVRRALPKGRSRLRVRGLTVLVDDRSLVAWARGDRARVVSARVRRLVEDTTTASSDEIAALEAELAATRDAAQSVQSSLQRLGARSSHLRARVAAWSAAVGSVPSRGGEAKAELARGFDGVRAESRATVEEYAAARRASQETTTALALAEAKLGLARAKKWRFEATVELEVEVDEPHDVEIELSYRTPCALWRPEHFARLERRGSGWEMSVTSYASVWQITGEDWTDVRCRFSTARPARSASPPLLTDDVLSTRKKTDDERKRIVVEAREQTIEAAGAAGTRDAESMPGVDDGGEARWLDAKETATLESTGRVSRVELGTRTMPCSVERVCWPEVTVAAHLRARATLSGAGPLLPGPVTVARESELVGRSTTLFVGVGEPFELGFGLDDGVRVRRRPVEKRRSTPVTGTQHVEREVSLYASNLSGNPRTLSLVERVPVSEIEDVTVGVEPQPGMRHDARDGFATFEMELGPNETREVVLRYRIEAKSNVVLPRMD